MNIILYSNKIDEYLKHDNVIDYDNESIIELADELSQKADDELDFIKTAYEFVRDNISHSADISEREQHIIKESDAHTQSQRATRQIKIWSKL